MSFWQRVKKFLSPGAEEESERRSYLRVPVFDTLPLVASLHGIDSEYKVLNISGNGVLLLGDRPSTLQVWAKYPLSITFNNERIRCASTAVRVDGAPVSLSFSIDGADLELVREIQGAALGERAEVISEAEPFAVRNGRFLKWVIWQEGSELLRWRSHLLHWQFEWDPQKGLEVGRIQNQFDTESLTSPFEARPQVEALDTMAPELKRSASAALRFCGHFDPMLKQKLLAQIEGF